MPGFKVDYALSGRSTCKACNNFIQQDSMRIGQMVQATTFDGEFPVWHHFQCFFNRFGDSIEDISVFVGREKLRWVDQQKLETEVFLRCLLC